MAIEYLDHFNIRCADVDRSRVFYCDVLGLSVGPRPAVGIPGYWLYCGGRPQVHLVARDVLPETALPVSNGAFDHVAFRLSDADGMMAKLTARAVPYTEQIFPDMGIHQIVLYDPDGIKVELNCSSG